MRGKYLDRGNSMLESLKVINKNNSDIDINSNEK